MKKLFIIPIILISIFLITGCESEEDSNKDLIKIDTNIKKTKYKKLICNLAIKKENVDGSVSIIYDYDENDKPTKIMASMQATFDKEAFDSLGNKKDEFMKEQEEDFKEFMLRNFDEDNQPELESSIRDNIVEVTIYSEKPEDLKSVGTIDEITKKHENDDFMCFVQDVSY